MLILFFSRFFYVDYLYLNFTEIIIVLGLFMQPFLWETISGYYNSSMMVFES